MSENVTVSKGSPISLKMDCSLPMTPFDTPQTLNYELPMAPRKNPQDQRPITQLHDASTFEGQQLGAILAVKRATNLSLPIAKVGDYVEVLAHYNVKYVEVKSVRTGVSGTIEWEDLLPVPYDGRCGCLDGGCRCVYETWQAYSARRPLPGLQNSRQIPVYGGVDMNGMNGMNGIYFDFPMKDWEHVEDLFTNTYLSTVAPPIQMSFSPNPPTQPEKIETKTQPEVNDPLTIAGQTPGAILVVKHHAHCPHDFGPILETEIGDRCRYLEAGEQGWGKVKVNNLRTGKEGFLRWEAFKPVSTRITCSCHKSYCYCEYEDFEKSHAYCDAQK